jgi:anthranilate phosphoribosyltransferase
VGFSWPNTLTKLLAGESLTESESSAAMTDIMEGAATPAQIAGFVVALRAKGETTDEVVGLVKTMRAWAASSRSGSADVLEALGVKIDLPPDGVERCIAEAGIGFCFAPVFHPAMRHAGATRRELGVATIFNFLGPLTNPAGARLQALGVSDPTMLPKMVETLGRLGSTHVIAFHGHGGLDELSTSGPSRVLELVDAGTREWEVDPAALGLPPSTREDIAGGSADENAILVRSVLDGEPGPRRDIVVLNAAAGLLAAAIAHDMAGAMRVAGEAIDSGAAGDTLDRLIAASNE